MLNNSHFSWYNSKFSFAVKNLLLLLFPLLFSLSCKDEKCGGSRDNYWYDLEAIIDLSPIKETYNIGDTISMEVTFPRSIFDRNHDVFETLEGINIIHGWWVAKLDSVDRIGIDATQNISLLAGGTTVGRSALEIFSNSSNARGTFEKTQEGDFVVNYKFTLDRSGSYWLRFTQYVEWLENANGNDPIVLQNECSNGHFKLSYAVQNVPDDNLLLLCEGNPPTGFCDQNIEDYRTGIARQGSYIFKVVE